MQFEKKSKFFKEEQCNIKNYSQFLLLHFLYFLLRAPCKVET